MSACAAWAKPWISVTSLRTYRRLSVEVMLSSDDKGIDGDEESVDEDKENEEECVMVWMQAWTRRVRFLKGAVVSPCSSSKNRSFASTNGWILPSQLISVVMSSRQESASLKRTWAMVFPLIARHAAVRCSAEGELGPVRKRSTAASSRART